MQLERLTGGAVCAGMHEVVVLPDTIAAAERREAEGRPAWRISSTLFAHVASANELRPLGGFASDASVAAYPPITAGEHTMNILKKINLADDTKEEGEGEEAAAAAEAPDAKA